MIRWLGCRLAREWGQLVAHAPYRTSFTRAGAPPGRGNAAGRVCSRALPVRWRVPGFRVRILGLLVLVLGLECVAVLLGRRLVFETTRALINPRRGSDCFTCVAHLL